MNSNQSPVNATELQLHGVGNSIDRRECVFAHVALAYNYLKSAQIPSIVVFLPLSLHSIGNPFVHVTSQMPHDLARYFHHKHIVLAPNVYLEIFLSLW